MPTWSRTRFHVLRLLSPYMNRRHRLGVGDRHSAALRRLLLRSHFPLIPVSRFALDRWLQTTRSSSSSLLLRGDPQRLLHRGADRAGRALPGSTHHEVS